VTSSREQPRTQVRRLPEKAVTDRARLDALLDEALVAHVAVADASGPVVVPMACARDGDDLLVHGSGASRLVRALASGAPSCTTVTALDGAVYARSAFHSSMRYRSAVVFGAYRPVDDALRGLRVLTEHLLPGRWDVLRAPTAKELAATRVLAVPLQEWSLKVADGWPQDEPEDLADPVWAGVLPCRTVWDPPLDAPDLGPDRPAPASVRGRGAAR
jgi:nitroimidazol reductase NimA-like FMN-containing flavoprotein (pyridoxamine 5'-phosphate oxidase superfamily)